MAETKNGYRFAEVGKGYSYYIKFDLNSWNRESLEVTLELPLMKQEDSDPFR